MLGFSLFFSLRTFSQEDVAAMVDLQVKTTQQSVSNNVVEMEQEAVAADTRGEGEETRLKASLEQREANRKVKAVAEVGEQVKDKLSEPMGEESSLLPRIVGEVKKRWPFIVYASLRINAGYSDRAIELSDGGSRLGVYYNQPLSVPGSLFGRGEVGVNVVDEVSFLGSSDANANNGETGSTFNPRLYYLGYEHDELRVLIGKNWSAYYDIAGWTDNFAVFGGLGVGAYNVDTDGGGSGTGRADKAGQLRWQHGGLHLAAQAQVGTQIPEYTDERYSLGLGLSLIQQLESGWSIGGAYNYAQPRNITDEMRVGGYRGNDESLLFGLRYRQDAWRVAASFASMRNHMTDDQGQYFKGWGLEVYGRYDVMRHLRMIAGVNISHPRDDEYEGDFQDRNYIAGIHYAVGRASSTYRHTFDDMVYLELQMTQGRLADGATSDNTIAMGFRKKFVR